MSSATQWTASRIAQPFRSCYARPGTAGNSPTVSRSLSDNDFEPGCMVRDDTGAGGGEGGAGATTSSVLRLLTFGNLRKRTVGGGAPPQQAAAFSSLEDAAAAAAAAGGDDVVTAEAGAAASDASGSSGAGAAYLLQAPQVRAADARAQHGLRHPVHVPLHPRLPLAIGGPIPRLSAKERHHQN